MTPESILLILSKILVPDLSGVRRTPALRFLSGSGVENGHPKLVLSILTTDDELCKGLSAEIDSALRLEYDGPPASAPLVEVRAVRPPPKGMILMTTKGNVRRVAHVMELEPSRSLLDTVRHLAAHNSTEEANKVIIEAERAGASPKTLRRMRESVQAACATKASP